MQAVKQASLTLRTFRAGEFESARFDSPEGNYVQLQGLST